MNNFDAALESIRNGKPVLIFDSKDREGETDITFGSQFITHDAIRMMRKDGGGLICVTIPFNAALVLKLDYLVNIYKKTGLELFKKLYPNDIPYDEKSAFSITINHRNTFTGIPDIDRALTISEFSRIVEKAIESFGNKKNESKVFAEFGRHFRTPGHVHTLIASKNPIIDRRGHTELATVLAAEAGIIPSATIVEMLGDDGRSLPKEKAMRYAKVKGFKFIEGKEIIDALDIR